jgi:hypothetical protein
MFIAPEFLVYPAPSGAACKLKREVCLSWRLYALILLLLLVLGLIY